MQYEEPSEIHESDIESGDSVTLTLDPAESEYDDTYEGEVADVRDDFVAIQVDDDTRLAIAFRRTPSYLERDATDVVEYRNYTGGGLWEASHHVGTFETLEVGS